MTWRSIFLFALSLLALQGCLGGNNKDLRDKPLELERIEDGLAVRSLWSIRLGRDAEDLNLGLRPESDGTRVFAAAHSGEVSGIDLTSGKRDWRVETGLPLSAGPGYGSGLVIAGSADGDVVALDATTGTELWRQAVSGEILAAPVIFSGVVIVRSVDGGVHALEARDGALRWTIQVSVPGLILRGSGQPAVAGDRVVVGFDNGQVAALSLRDGADLWRAPLAMGRGRTELERMSDVDSDVVIFGDEVYVAGFQSRAALLFLGNGQPAWIVDLSSAGGLAIGQDAFFSTAGDSTVAALERATGALVWEQKGLLHRGVTGPTLFGDTVVVGDFEGYVHWLFVDDGSLVGRARAGKASIVAKPLAVGNRLFVQDEAGVLHAFAVPGAQQ